MVIRSVGTGVPSLKVCEKFINSFSFFFLASSCFSRAPKRSFCAKVLNALWTSFSIGWTSLGGETLRGVVRDARKAAVFSLFESSWVLLALWGALATSLGVASGSLVSALGASAAGFRAAAFSSSGFGAAFSLAGARSCDEMIAGSTGAPLTVACPVGARRAGGVYLLDPWPVRGGKSARLTPLYLYGC